MYWLTWPQFSCLIKILENLMRPALVKTFVCIFCHLNGILYFEEDLKTETAK